MIALTILSGVLIALGALMFQVGRHAHGSAGQTYEAAAKQQGVAYVQTLPWNSLYSAAGCVSDSSGAMAYQRCITVSDSTPRIRRVAVVIQPEGPFTRPPDTTLVYRHRPRSVSVLR